FFPQLYSSSFSLPTPLPCPHPNRPPLCTSPLLPSPPPPPPTPDRPLFPADPALIPADPALIPAGPALIRGDPALIPADPAAVTRCGSPMHAEVVADWLGPVEDVPRTKSALPDSVRACRRDGRMRGRREGMVCAFKLLR